MLNQFLLGGCLAACSGVRGFVTLFFLAYAIGHGQIDGSTVNPVIKPFITGNTIVYNILMVLAIIEILGDKAPVIDHFLDALHMILGPLAAAVAIFTILQLPDSLLNYIVALVMSCCISIPLHSYKSGIRILSYAGYYGNFNMYLSLTEDIMVLGSLAVAMFNPGLSFLGTVIIFYVVFHQFKKWRIRLVAGDEITAQVQADIRSDSEVMEIKALKKMKK